MTKIQLLDDRLRNDYPLEHESNGGKVKIYVISNIHPISVDLFYLYSELSLINERGNKDCFLIGLSSDLEGPITYRGGVRKFNDHLEIIIQYLRRKNLKAYCFKNQGTSIAFKIEKFINLNPYWNNNNPLEKDYFEMLYKIVKSSSSDIFLFCGIGKFQNDLNKEIAELMEINNGISTNSMKVNFDLIFKELQYYNTM